MNEIVDFHCHIYPDTIAEKLISRMEEVYHVKRSHNATYDALIKSLNNGEVSRAVILAVANKPEHFETNQFYAELAQSDDRIISFGSIHPENKPKDLYRFQDWELTGIKWQPNAQQFYPDEERMFEFYSIAQELDLIVSFHCGNEEDGVYGKYAQPRSFVKVLKKFPDLKIVLTHLGGYQTWDDLDLVLGYENVFYDTAHLPGNISDSLINELVTRIGIERVIFGTDFPWDDHQQQVNHIKRLFGAEAEAILSLNPLKLLNSHKTED